MATKLLSAIHKNTKVKALTGIFVFLMYRLLAIGCQNGKAQNNHKWNKHRQEVQICQGDWTSLIN